MRSLTRILTLLALCTSTAFAEELVVAVASNFRPALQELSTAFTAETGHTVVISSGSTGRHYAQIVNGAPFDLFLAADAARPRQLVADGYADESFTYAIGRLALWGNSKTIPDDVADWLTSDDVKHIAIANPRLAPYGVAAVETLEAMNIYSQLTNKFVTGENISQAYQFIASGNADAGLVAWSQLINTQTGYLLIPEDQHAPIEQQIVVLHDSDAAAAFTEFLRGAAATRIIEDNGYVVPADRDQ